MHEIDGLLNGGTLVSDEIEWFDFSDDGALMTMVTAGGSAAMVEAHDWSGFEQFELDGGQAISSVAISHDGSTAALHDTDGVLHLLDLKSGVIMQGPVIGIAPTESTMKALAFGPNDATILVGRDDGVQIFDIATGRPIGGTFPNDGLLYGTPSHDGLQAITGLGDNLLCSSGTSTRSNGPASSAGPSGATSPPTNGLPTPLPANHFAASARRGSGNNARVVPSNSSRRELHNDPTRLHVQRTQVSGELSALTDRSVRRLQAPKHLIATRNRPITTPITSTIVA